MRWCLKNKKFVSIKLLKYNLQAKENAGLDSCLITISFPKPESSPDTTEGPQ